MAESVGQVDGTLGAKSSQPRSATTRVTLYWFRYSPRVGHYLCRLLRMQFSEVERNWHAVHVAAHRGGPSVDIGVGVHPYHTGVGVGYQVSSKGPAICG